MFSKRLKFLFTLFAIFFAFTLTYLPGFSKYQELKRKELEITQEIDRLKGIAEKLSKEEKLLETDSEYLEKVVRENLGRAKPGEVVYKIVPADNKKSGSERAEKHDTISVSAT